jgi:hypothetical protein
MNTYAEPGLYNFNLNCTTKDIFDIELNGNTNINLKSCVY